MSFTKSKIVFGRLFKVNVFVLAFMCFGLTQTHAQQGVKSESERGAAAIGHYARARTLLIEALAEFELGKRLADPDLLLDSDKWRMTLVSRAEELNKVLDPKPRITRSGVRYQAQSRLIREDRKLSSEEVILFPKSDNIASERWPSEHKKTTHIKAMTPEPVVTEQKPLASIPMAQVVKEQAEQSQIEPLENEDEFISEAPSTKEVTDKRDKVDVTKPIEQLPPAAKVAENKPEVTSEHKVTDESAFVSDTIGQGDKEDLDELDVDKAIEAVIQQKLQDLGKKGSE